MDNKPYAGEIRGTIEVIRIAHRGNYRGKDHRKENTISHIEEAIGHGYDVEIDIWLLDGKYYLGHDFPGEQVDLSFMERSSIWTHAKNLEAYVALYGQKKVHVFWHDKDEFTYTSKGIKWARTDVITYDGIMVMPYITLNEIVNGSITPLGVCMDDFSLITVDVKV